MISRLRPCAGHFNPRKTMERFRESFVEARDLKIDYVLNRGSHDHLVQRFILKLLPQREQQIGEQT